MIDIGKYTYLFDKQIKVTCTDEQMFFGKFTDWTSSQDNEPDPESITVSKPWGEQIEIYIDEIKSIEAVK